MIGLAKQILLMSAAVFNVPIAPIISRLAHRMQTPATFAATTSTGAAYNFSALTLVNDSGAPMTTASIVLLGFIRNAANSAEVPCGNDFTATGTIEYPVGTTIGTFTKGGSSNMLVVNNQRMDGDDVTLAATIPTGAIFGVRLSTTVPSGQKYIIQCGFAGVRTKAPLNTLSKEGIYVIGDSINTANGGAIRNACAGLFPCYSQSISGSTTQSFAADFTKRIELAQALGLTRFISNFGTNDFGTNNRSVAQLQGDLTTIRDGVRAVGMKFTQCTITPRTTMSTIAVSGATYASGFVTLNVPNASIFEVGRFYEVMGASPSGYNGFMEVTARDTTLNTITFEHPTLTSPATGTITITAVRRPDSSNSHTWTNIGLQVPVAGYEAGGASKKALINDWIRGGNVDGFIDWADRLETSRNSGLWATGKEKASLGQEVLGLSVTGLNSANSFKTDYTAANDTASAGYLVWRTGANIGIGHLIATQKSNAISGFTLFDTPPNAVAIGDTFDLIPSGYYQSLDGLHPYSAVFGGGQKAIEAEAITFLQGLAA